MDTARRWITVVVLVLVVGAVAAYFVRNTLVRSALEDASERSLGVATTVASVDLDLLGHSLTVSKYRAANPTGFPEEPFLSVGRGQVEVEGSTVFSDPVRVRRLEIEEVRLGLVQRGKDANYSVVMDHLESARSAGRNDRSSGASLDEEGPAAAAGTGENGPRVVIEEIVVRDVVVEADADFPGAEPLHEEISLGEFRLEDVSSAEGLPLDRVIARLVQGLVDAAVQRGATRLPDRLASRLTDRVEGLPELDEIGSGARAVADSLGESLGERAGEAVSDLIGGSGSDGRR